MNKRKVSEEEQAIHIKNLEQKWDIEMGKHYWYPLYKCRREDVVAFKELDIEDKKDKIKVEIIVDSILELGDLKVYEMNEFEKSIYGIDTASLEPFYSADGNGEKIWFSGKMNWVIYVFHEGSITFGGKSFIKKIKEKWENWQSDLY